MPCAAHHCARLTFLEFVKELCTLLFIGGLAPLVLSRRRRICTQCSQDSLLTNASGRRVTQVCTYLLDSQTFADLCKDKCRKGFLTDAHNRYFSPHLKIWCLDVRCHAQWLNMHTPHGFVKIRPLISIFSLALSSRYKHLLDRTKGRLAMRRSPLREADIP